MKLHKPALWPPHAAMARVWREFGLQSTVHRCLPATRKCNTFCYTAKETMREVKLQRGDACHISTGFLWVGVNKLKWINKYFMEPV